MCFELKIKLFFFQKKKTFFAPPRQCKFENSIISRLAPNTRVLAWINVMGSENTPLQAAASARLYERIQRLLYEGHSPFEISKTNLQKPVALAARAMPFCKEDDGKCERLLRLVSF